MNLFRLLWIGLAITVISAPATGAAQSPPSQEPRPEVKVLLDKAAALSKEFKWDETAAACLIAAKKAEEIGDVFGLGVSHMRAGSAYYSKGDLNTARTYFSLARDNFMKAGARAEQMGAAMNIAVILDNTGHPDEARPIYLEFLAYSREFKLERGIATALMNLAILETRSDHYEAGIKYALEAREVYAGLKDLRWQSGAWSQAGEGYRALGRYEEAEKAFKEALDLAKQSGAKPAESAVLYTLGDFYRIRGDYPRALELTNEAYQMRVAINDTRGQMNALMTLGIIYQHLGQADLGIDYLRRSVDIARRLRNPVTTSTAVGNLGVALIQARRYGEAKPLVQEALELSRQRGDTASVATWSSNLGLVLRNEGRNDEAVRTLRAALPIFKELGAREMYATATDYLGSALVKLRKYDEAIAEYKGALALYAEVSNQRYAAVTYANLAKAYEKKGQPDEAEKAYRTFVRLTEDTRSRLGASPEGKAEYLGERLVRYQDFIALLVRRGKVEEAFSLAQQTKARSLVDLLNTANIAVTSQMSPAERAEERRLRLKADSINADMVKEGAQNEVGAKKRFAALKQDLAKAENELSAFTLGLYAKYPDLAQKRGSGLVTLAQLGAHLPEDTALLEFAGGKHALLFVVTSKAGRASVKAVMLKGDLATDARLFGHLTANPKSDYRAVAASLYQRLIGPVEGSIAGKKRLVVCPEGALWDIPFAALSKNGFLSDRFEISYAYSATAADATLKRKSGRLNLGSTLVVANPDFGGTARFGDNALIPGQRPIEPPSRPIEPPSRPIEPPSRPIEPPSRDLSLGMRGGLVDLPGTQLEANALARMLPGTTVLAGMAAQESAVLKVAGKHRIVHIATHAFFNDASPMLSSIILAKPSDASADGYLTAREIFGMKLNADMVVLSACNTARGATRTGDGIVGLSWALLAAGAPAQVVSQWSVDDRATAVLMERFYRNLKSGQRKDQALKNAATSLRDPKVKGNDPKWRHPYYWAPFILLGDSR